MCVHRYVCVSVTCMCVCVQSVSEEEEVPVEELSSEEEEELPLKRLAPPPEAPPPAAFSEERERGGKREISIWCVVKTCLTITTSTLSHPSLWRSAPCGTHVTNTSHSSSKWDCSRVQPVTPAHDGSSGVRHLQVHDETRGDK